MTPDEIKQLIMNELISVLKGTDPAFSQYQRLLIAMRLQTLAGLGDSGTTTFTN